MTALELSPTIGSLFAGIGGFDLGFERAGFKTIWQCEIDKAAQGVLRRHFPDAKLHSDVCQVGAHNLEPVDVVTFGSPCFPAGVLVLTRRGLVPIEEVVVGDEVVSHLGRWQTVVRVGSKIAPTLRLKGQGHPGLVTTEEHPFWASAVGADLTLSPQEWVPAKDMKGRLWAQLTSIPAEAKRDYEQVCHRMGPVLHNGYRMGLVRECAPTGNEERVYNIEVEGDHSYTADGIIVHNCQDLSVAGKRAGLAGGRSGLFHEAARVIRELRDKYGKPDFAIWENVPGAFSSNEGRDFAAVVQAMVDIGARDICWRVLDSRYFGVAQRRRRVFLVADFGGERAEQILFEPESLRGNIAKGRKARKEAPAGIGSGAAGGGESFRILRTDEYRADTVASTVSARDYKSATDLVVPFDTTQITSPSNYSSPKAGDPCHPLAAGAHPPAVVFQLNGDRDNPGVSVSDGVAFCLPANPMSDRAQAVAFAQKTRDEVRLLGGDGQIVGALAAQPGMKQTTYVAQAREPICYATQPKAFAFDGFQSAAPKATVQFRVEETAPLISTRPHCIGPMQPIAFHPTQDPISSTNGVSHTMSNGSKGGTATVAVAVGFDATGSTADASEELHPVLRGVTAGNAGHHTGVAVCATGEVTHALTSASSKGATEDGTGRGTPLAAFLPMQVRRLTPTECEALQGFPCNHTAEVVLPNGTIKPQADGPRYKQLGNAVTVNVTEWIGKRVMAAFYPADDQEQATGGPTP